jgi:hypothetical protein
VGWSIALTLSERAAFRDFSSGTYLADVAPAADVDQYNWAVVIGRRPERTDLRDTTPYRSSPLALYQREQGKSWRKRHGDLLCRSTTTTARPPQHADREAVVSFASERGTRYRWGHTSVPEGLHGLTPTPWRTGDSAFLISTLHGADGTIALDEPQTLITVKVASDEVTGAATIIPDPDVEPIVSYVKEWCHIHPSGTQGWSHRDSLGCINLLKTSEQDDYGEFFRWIEEHGLLDQPLALYIASFENLAEPGADTLPDTLTIEGL